MEARQSVRRQHDLIVVLAQQVQHVRDQDDERVRRAVDEGPRQFWQLGC